MKYAVRRGGESIAETEWEPLAQAAWHRATRDQAAGGTVELLKDGRIIAAHRIVGGAGARWPAGTETTWRDVVKAIFQLLRDDGWDTKQIADAMTAFGLPTSRARAEAIKGTSSGRSIDLSPAEVVVMLHAVLNEYKKDEAK